MPILISAKIRIFYKSISIARGKGIRYFDNNEAYALYRTTWSPNLLFYYRFAYKIEE